MGYFCADRNLCQAFHSKDSAYLPTFPALSAAEYAIGLSNGSRHANKLGRRRGVEREHLVVTGNHQSCAGGFRELRGLAAVQIARHAAFWRAAIDRQQGHVNVEQAKALRHARVEQRIAAAIDAPATKLH